ncbi:TPA_asm: hypothetical protein HUJ06_031763 [Nelumbo nucifera]|uniref:Uncharacterized protein n=1 Tax=Nelumbo nucifera TaxID=4432 RepID=A0A823A5M6_NELNU|nr:TPA_asm: hypothetical protein HUJ06_021265 [Nelumbo nucifera]DAD49826.1 TPA_asm: hypothetical protein HUJ06_031763 [Nelumbo nucifera]
MSVQRSRCCKRKEERKQDDESD